MDNDKKTMENPGTEGQQGTTAHEREGPTDQQVAKEEIPDDATSAMNQNMEDEDTDDPDELR